MKDIIAYDSTLVEHAGRWWLFANVVEHPGIASTEELFVFHADSPLSTEWISHPLNPVISDVRRARPAGPVFQHNGALYRPSQDSAERYGHKLRLNEIVTLDPCAYEEREVSVVEPAWDRRIVGVHHLSFDGQLTLMDAQMVRRGVVRTVDR